MAVSIVANWCFGLLVWGNSTIKRKVFLVTSVVFNVAVIGFFKYEGFIAQNLHVVFGTWVIPDLQLPLPIGISFYTLQALSYVIDVYRGDVEAQRNPLYLGMYVASFPQLIAGPIVRYSTIQEQVFNRRECIERCASGLRLFAVGIAKKVLLANVVAILAAKMLQKGGPQIGAVGAWAGLVAYTFQIFFDFSGYSDMAIGLGRMMGFEYLRNFNYPYVSMSITEFWRRWHISLSSFFRDYVYIPLGGSRCSKLRNAANILVVWAITGLWHGASWNFIGWGAFYGVLLLLEKFVWGGLLGKLPRPVRHLCTMGVVMFGWSFFWIADTWALLRYWKALAFGYGLTGGSTFWELTAWEYWPVLVACTVASTPIVPLIKERVIAWAEEGKPESVMIGGTADPRAVEARELCTLEVVPADSRRENVLIVVGLARDIALVLLMLLSMASIVSGSFNPFIYFQF